MLPSVGLLFWLAVPAMGVSPSQVRLELEAPSRARAGETVAVVLRLRNPGAETQTVFLRGRQVAFDLEVTDSAGARVWRRLEGEVIPAIVQVREIPPGGVLVFPSHWPGRDLRGKPVPPGRYVLRASVLTDEAPIESPAVEVELVTP